MVLGKKSFKWVISFSVICFFSTFIGAEENIEPNTETLILTPQQVVNLTIKQSHKKAEIELKAKSAKVELARALRDFQWNMSLETSYFFTEAENLSGFANDEDQQVVGKWAINKKFLSGTSATLAYDQTNVSREFSSFTSGIGIPSNQVMSHFSLEFSQDLWNNYFGLADRLKVKNVRFQIEEAAWQEKEQLEQHLLGMLDVFWKAYIAQETLTEATQSRDRYKRLFNLVRRKSRYGNVAPGELARTRAELSMQDEGVKMASVDYLRVLDELKRELSLGQKKQKIVFQVEDQIPDIPVYGKLNVANLRVVKEKVHQIKRAQNEIRMNRNGRDPVVQLVGRLESTGIEETSDDALSELSGMTKPTYYVGLRVQVALGREIKQAEEAHVQNQYTLSQLQLKMSKDEVVDQLSQMERLVKANFMVLQNKIKQEKDRQLAYTQVQRAFQQGRLGLSEVIIAANTLNSVKTSKLEAIGNYHSSINSLAALRDELIKN